MFSSPSGSYVSSPPHSHRDSNRESNRAKRLSEILIQPSPVGSRLSSRVHSRAPSPLVLHGPVPSPYQQSGEGSGFVSPCSSGSASGSSPAFHYHHSPSLVGPLVSDVSFFPVDTESELSMTQYGEEIYRRHLATEERTEFVAVVEMAWDEREVFHFVARESVRRFWLETEERKAYESDEALLTDDIWRSAAKNILIDLNGEERAARESLAAEMVIAEEEIRKVERGSFLAALALSRRREREELETSVEQQGLTETQPPTEATTQQEHPPTVLTPAPPKSKSDTVTSGTYRLGRKVREDAVLSVVEQGEESRRVQIAQGCWAIVEKVLVPTCLELRYLATVGSARYLVEYEADAGRRQIANERCAFMLSLCQIQESLHRRELSFNTIPAEMKEVLNQELGSWLHARKDEQDRVVAEELQDAASRESFRKQREQLEEDRLQQKLAMSRDELDGRIALQHEANSDWAVCCYNFEEQTARLMPLQVEYAMELHRRATSVVWDRETWANVYLREFENRLSLEAEERTAWMLLDRAQRTCYLATLRKWAIDEEVGQEMKLYDAGVTRLSISA